MKPMVAKITTLLCLILLGPSLRAQQLPGTQPLTREGDLAAQMVAGIDKYLMRELAASPSRRKAVWQPDYSTVAAYLDSVQPHRQRLAQLLGAGEPRLAAVDLELVATLHTPALVSESSSFRVFAVRWPVLPGVDAEGLLLEPKGKAVACVVAIPDADWTPEMLVGIAAGIPPEAQFARRLAESGCRVLVPTIIDRKDTWSGNPKFHMTNQPHREFVYRMAYELGGHIIRPSA
jgi:hypothetical protein